MVLPEGRDAKFGDFGDLGESRPGGDFDGKSDENRQT
jgi:hypothetical protein